MTKIITLVLHNCCECPKERSGYNWNLEKYVYECALTKKKVPEKGIPDECPLNDAYEVD